MKAGIGDIVGKRIVRIIVAENDLGPRSLVFLIFSDGGTSLELHGDSLNCGSRLDNGGAFGRGLDQSPRERPMGSCSGPASDRARLCGGDIRLPRLSRVPRSAQIAAARGVAPTHEVTRALRRDGGPATCG